LQLVPTKSLDESDPGGIRRCILCRSLSEVKTFATFVQPSIKGVSSKIIVKVTLTVSEVGAHAVRNSGVYCVSVHRWTATK